MNGSRRRVSALFAGIVALATAGCAEKAATAWSGYAEADYVYLSSSVSGTLQNLAVRRGDAVQAGAILFALDADNESAASGEALARLDAARALSSDATKGRRADEVAVTQAQLAQARAQVELATNQLAREQQLVVQGFTAKARLEDARSTLDQARQRVAELQAALRVAMLPSREDQRAAASATAQAQAQVLAQSQWRERQTQQRAPAPARVADTFYRAGEWVPAGQPVLALLPAGAIHARFFVPEADIAAVAVGQAVTLRCDGCAKAIAAHIDFIASRVEYTPPVIYSNAQRARLVFMVEAQPDDPAARMQPGQPLDVQLSKTKPS